MARLFYGTLFGLTELTPPASIAELPEIWFQLDDDTELHLFIEEPAGQDHSARHFCLAVDNIERLRQTLEDAGVTVVGDPARPNRPRYFCRDPFGNLVAITTIQSN